MTFTGVLLISSSLIELLAALVIFLYVLRVGVRLARRASTESARAVFAEGVLAALDLSVAATLLKVIGLQSWVEIRAFATVFVLRILLKQVFLRERSHIAFREGLDKSYGITCGAKNLSF